MFCSNCGHEIKEGIYCPICGNKNDTSAITKPLLTNVGKDPSLPKNSNFILTIAIVLFVMSISFIIMTGYIQDNQYYTSMKWSGFDISIPLGFKGSVRTNEDHESFLIQNDDVIYELYIDDDYYKNYVNNNFKETRTFLNKLGYSINSIDEIEYNNHKMLFSIIDIHSKDIDAEYADYTALYMTRIKDSDYMVSGYIYKTSPITIEDGYKMIDIVNNINRSE